MMRFSFEKKLVANENLVAFLCIFQEKTVVFIIIISHFGRVFPHHFRIFAICANVESRIAVQLENIEI